MQIPPHHLPPTSPTERPAASAQPPAQQQLKGAPSLANLSQLPPEELQQALRDLPTISPEALAKKLSIKQPTLIEALVAKQTPMTLSSALSKQMPAATREALAHWQNTPSANTSNADLMLTTLIVANSKAASIANQSPAASHQLAILTPQGQTQGQVGGNLTLTLSAKGELALPSAAAQKALAAANSNPTSLKPATTLEQALLQPKNTNLVTQPLLTSQASPTPQTVPSAGNLDNSQLQRLAALQQLARRLPTSLPQPASAPIHTSESNALPRIAETISRALAMPTSTQLQALPKPLMAAIEQAIPTLTMSGDSVPALSQQLTTLLAPGPQLQQLPALLSALAILSKLLPGNAPTHLSHALFEHTPSQANSQAGSAEAIHHLLKQELSQLSQSVSRSLLARSLGQFHEPLNLQQELSFHTDQGWLNGHIHIEEKPQRQPSHHPTHSASNHASWEVNLTLEVPMRNQAPLAIDVRVIWQQQQTQVTFWSQQPMTCKRLTEQKQTLIQALHQAGVPISDCTIVAGSAPTKTQAISHQWTNIDIHT